MHYDKQKIIRELQYDPSKETDILKRARSLIGLTVKEVLRLSGLSHNPNRLNKGEIGNTIEAHWFGIPNNSLDEPDFSEAGIELKVIPLDKTKTELTVKERTKICSIDYGTLIEEIWAKSKAKKKLNKILFIYYIYNNEENAQSVIRAVDLWELKGPASLIIESDWEGVKNRVVIGEAHLLSESHSKILAASRSGQGGVDANGRLRDLVSQPNNKNVDALRRAFSLKQSFTKQRWKELHEKEKYESIVDVLHISEAGQFEAKVLEKLREFEGKTLGEFASLMELSIPKGKNASATIVKKALGFKSVNSRIKEFEQFGITIRIVPVRRGDLKPIEAISFPAFKLQELENENWDEASIHEYIDRILIIPIYSQYLERTFQDEIIGKAFFWSPSKGEREIIQKEWEDYLKQIRAGKAKVRKVESGSGYKEVTGLSKESETQIIHIRPHAIDRNDRDTDSKGNSVVKQSFWLNKGFIQKLIKESQA